MTLGTTRRGNAATTAGDARDDKTVASTTSNTYNGHTYFTLINLHGDKGLFKGVGTKAPFYGGFAFAWLSTKLCARLQCPDLFMNRPAIKFLTLGRAS